ncbi:MAG: 6-phosphofructokinase [bacterium]|nr:6-phosphofructokinase [bacterium]
MMNLGIITSGGDCGGLNAVVKGAAQMANSLGIKLFVIPNGYAGLYNLIEFDSLVDLNESRAENFTSVLSGSEAGHSRVKIKKIDDKNKYKKIKEGLKKFDIDGLVISGGDDSGSVIVDLSENGIKCVHAPKTMDLDLQTYSVGGDSTVNRIADFVYDLKTTGKTHNRVIVTEVFGRYAGHTAFRGGVGAEADAILIPEIPSDFDLLYQDVKTKLIKRIKESDIHAGTYTLVVAEGLRDITGKEIVDESAGVDSFGHKKLAGAGKYTCQELEKRFKADDEITQFMKDTKMYVKGLYETPEVREVRPGHLVRCGKASAFDVNFGIEAGGAAVMLLKNDIYGVTVADVKGDKVRYMDTKAAIIPNHVDLDLVAFHEELGTCFARKKIKASPKFEKIKTQPERHF